MTWLITGGAGYIGSHVVRAMLAADVKVVVLDNLSSGFEAFVPEGVPLARVDVTDAAAVSAVMDEHGIVGVVHLAAYKYAGESVKKPLHTWKQNLVGTLSLLEAMEANGVDKLVLSSTAAVYGTPDEAVVTEATPTGPESPYGSSKLAAEWAIREQAHALSLAGTPLTYTALRYFNVVGSGFNDIYDASPHNLFPLVLGALARGEVPRINGDDYPTEDGTCVRDYVHVSDLADAHVAAAKRMMAGEPLETVYNLGSGSGTSVREIVEACIKATETDVEPLVQARRPGDPARIVASGELAAKDLGWAMTHTVEDMVQSAWAAQPRA